MNKSILCKSILKNSCYTTATKVFIMLSVVFTETFDQEITFIS